MIWNETAECMDAEQRREMQSRRLRDTVARVYQNVEFYRKKMQELGIEPGDVKTIEDIVKLPFTTKKDLRENYPFGLCAAPESQFVRIHASSGTTGKPTAVPYTRKDLDNFSECVARAICCTGGTNKDVIQIAYGYGLFTGGLGLHDGATKLGAGVIPSSGGNTRNQLTLMKDFKSTILACTPSYAMFLAESLQEAGIRKEELSLKIGIFGAEPWSNEMRKKIQEGLGLTAYDIYGLSEIMGPGVAASCAVQDGLHVAEDHFYPEILNPDTLEPVADGTVGELVFTHLTKEAMPLLRYRTRDLSSIEHGSCACGRTTAKMGRILGRSDDMLIIRGVNVFPSQVESVLLEVAEVSPNYVIIVDRQGTMDTIEVKVELDERYVPDDLGDLERIKETIKHKLNSVLRIGVRVTLAEHKTIERSEGKAKRVVDRRHI
ncbi:phenylacetate--CoA ligase family protein [Aminipila luticellarii]|uniref:Phenylacetate-coenzyme A ligase n=1 Tax=Aminipila luticellarii TaxID=2507160 RepID=A0A410PW10_9FIRM|nr:phenylacetate--CoA ligase [Aminipila luticellarii]QAT43132.1 phenylacetate--CoA ligase [Aminipila luticellarii]